MFKPATFFSVIVFFLVLTFIPVPAKSSQVNIYSARQEHLIKPLLDEFSRETGISYRLLTGQGPALLERLKNEGRNSPADILITVDVGNLVAAKEAGVLRPVSSDILNKNIPVQYRDDQGKWYGLSARSRVVYYAPDRVDPERIPDYESLAVEGLGYGVCVRSSSNIYNQSLMASMVAHLGKEKAYAWARGLVNNFARRPQDNDTGQIRAVAAGECDVAIANSYYFARLMASGNPADQEVVSRVRLHWPNQDGRGAHMNLSGAGVTSSASNPEQALKLIEFLSLPWAQEFYARENNEYPVNPEVQASGVVLELGSFKADDLNLAEIEKYNAQAQRIMDRAGWR